MQQASAFALETRIERTHAPNCFIFSSSWISMKQHGQRAQIGRVTNAPQQFYVLTKHMNSCVAFTKQRLP